MTLRQQITRIESCPECHAPPDMDFTGPHLQTPADDDGMVRRVYVKCISCGHVGPVRQITPVHWIDSGKLPYADCIAPWNRAALTKSQRQEVQTNG